MNGKNIQLRNLVYSSLCLALCLVLPFLTGQIPEIGKFLCPMHLPVLLCGLICSWYWGAAVGFIAPLLRCLLFGMPMIVKAVPMAFELAAYGAVAGLVFVLLSKKSSYIFNIYAALLSAMLCGRLVWGLATYVCVLIGFANSSFTFTVFLTTEFVGTWAGVVIQLLLIPPIVLMMRRAKLINVK